MPDFQTHKGEDNFFTMPTEKQTEIMMKAIEGSNKAQRDLVNIKVDIERQGVVIEKRDLTKTRSTGEFEEKLEPRIEKDFCEALLDGDAVNDFQQIKAWRVIEWVEKYISELLNQATQDAYKKGYVDGGLDEILRDKKAKNKLMKYLDND